MSRLWVTSCQNFCRKYLFALWNGKTTPFSRIILYRHDKLTLQVLCKTIQLTCEHESVGQIPFWKFWKADSTLNSISLLWFVQVNLSTWWPFQTNNSNVHIRMLFFIFAWPWLWFINYAHIAPALRKSSLRSSTPDKILQFKIERGDRTEIFIPPILRNN